MANAAHQFRQQALTNRVGIERMTPGYQGGASEESAAREESNLLQLRQKAEAKRKAFAAKIESSRNLFLAAEEYAR